jgi:serine/threonine-protein kinase
MPDADDPEVPRTQSWADYAAPLSPRRPAIPGYELLEEAGRGGMARVFRARDLRQNRLVAVKLPHLRPHGPLADQFRNEAAILDRVRHANVVRVLDRGQVDGWPFLVLEYLEGGTLAARIGGQAQPVRQTIQVMQTIARAVHHVHQNGIVHRNLKPPTVMFSSGGEVRIINFTLAQGTQRSGDELDQEGQIIGTPSYMAPEQATGRPVGPAADVYALGVILYEMLTGQPPFRADSLLEILHQIISAPPPPPRQLNPRVGRRLEALCLRCLSKEPGKRPGSAADLVSDLERVLNSWFG